MHAAQRIPNVRVLKQHPHVCRAVVHMQTRKRMRAKYNLEESPCGDCCTTTFWCAFSV